MPRFSAQFVISVAMLAVVVVAAGLDASFISVLAITVAGGLAFSIRDRRWYPARHFAAGVGAVVLGATLRYEVLQRLYGGFGDALRYFDVGARRAEGIRSSLTWPLTPGYWDPGTSRWGTAFVEQLSGVILAVIGPSMRAEFLVFGLIGFVGTYHLVKAHRWVNPVKPSLTVAALIWLWPSIWYWPSSVGKEALILCAIGLTTYGYVGDGTRQRPRYLAAGLALSFMVRPHVTGVLVVAMAIAHVIEPWGGRVTNRRVFEIIATGVLTIVVLIAAVQRLGIDDTDLEGLQEFAIAQQAGTLKGGSNIGAVQGALAPAQALVNVWSRPFPWEARSAAAVVASGEVVLLWALVVWRRRQLWSTLRRWRHNRLLRFAVPLVLGYSLMIGLTFGNLGIIARQRAPMFPMLLIVLVGAESSAGAQAKRRRGATMSARPLRTAS